MSRYINTDEFKKRIDRYPPEIRNIAKKELRYTPTADVVKRKTGEWINNRGLYQCSYCKHIWSELWWVENCPIEQMYKIMPLCPKCGAEMKRKDDADVLQ